MMSKPGPSGAKDQVLELFFKLSCLNITDPDSRKLYEDIASIAVEYQEVFYEARRNVRRIDRFASDVLLAFEGLKKGDYTPEEVYKDFREDMEEKMGDMKLLEELLPKLKRLEDEINELKSKRLPWEREHTGTGITGAIQALNPELLIKFAVLFVPKYNAQIQTGGEIVVHLYKQWNDRRAENETRLENVRHGLTTVNSNIRALRAQWNELQDISEKKMENLHSKLEKRLESGSPTTLAVDKIIKTAKELEKHCKKFGDESLF